MDYGYKYDHPPKCQISRLISHSLNSYTLIDGQYGFAPDALDSVENFKEQLFAVASIRSNSEGVYNLPVCVLNQLSSMPECYKAVTWSGAKTPITWDQADHCFLHPINCLGSKWPVSS